MTGTTTAPHGDAALGLRLFEAALERPVGERRAWIEASGAEPGTLRTALALLAAHEASAGFLEPAPAFEPRELGPYRLIQRLGAGGMGQVWLAERRDGAFEQRVAIKVLASALGDPESIRRAESERQFLAWLDHPNIARVLDGGTTAQGQPYVAMEYVEGDPIDDWCRVHAENARARVILFLEVLAAVDAAHRALIIHRDIKPANILVNRDGVAKLLDFGIAKSLDGRIGGATRTGFMPMTPEYASPEQLAGKPLTTACDIYALGLVLYELLTGRNAHADVPTADLARHIAAQAPTRPSTRVDADRLGLAPRAIAEHRRQLAGDLDRVVLKALEPEPERRYASVRAFADDLERWLDDRPVLARPSSTWYRARKFVQRNRVPVAASVVAFGAIVFGIAFSLVQAHRAAAEGERAQRANRFLTGMIGRADPYYGGKPPLLVDALDRAVVDIPQQLAGQPLLEADIRRAIGHAYLMLERNDAAKVQLELAASLRADAGGTDYAKVLDSQALLEWQLGHYAAAEALLKRGLDNCEGDARGRTQRAELLNDYAALLNDVGRYAEALPVAEESLRLKDALPDVAPRERAVTLSNLASTLDGLGRFERANQTYQETLRLFESIEPPPELDIAVALNNLAYLQEEMGHLDEAVRLQERAVALYRKVMGPDFPRLTVQLSNLALRYAKLGRHDDAASAIRDSLRLAPKAFRDNDQKLGNMHTAAARVALMRGDVDEAIAEAAQALAIYDRAETVEEGRREKTLAVLAEARAKKTPSSNP